jgi:hypothetical protein
MTAPGNCRNRIIKGRPLGVGYEHQSIITYERSTLNE